MTVSKNKAGYSTSERGDGVLPHPESPQQTNSSPDCFSCDAYLFDIDGTLLNSRDGVHYHAFHHAVRDVYGVDSSIDGVPVHGNTDIGILRAVVRRADLSDAQFEALLPHALEHMCSEVRRNRQDLRPELCPSIHDLLQTLRCAGKLMGVVSGNIDEIGWLKLRAAGIADYFSFGSFSAHLKLRLRQPDEFQCPTFREANVGTSPSTGTWLTSELRSDIFRNGIREARAHLSPTASVCVVGDTPSDIAAARDVQVPIIAVATGIFTADQLREYHPDACAPCCTDLLHRFQ